MVLEKDIQDFEKSKNRIVFELSRKEDSAEEVSIPYLDMAITFRYIVGIFQDEIASIPLRQEHLDIWGVTTADIMKCARENTPKILPPRITPMAEALKELSGIDIIDDIPDMTLAPLFILTNEYSTRGAATLLYPDLIENFAAQYGSDVCIIPSSIHELILVPDLMGITTSTYTSMIQEVNATEVDPKEVLSDHPYYYSLKEGKIVRRAVG
jgi:hypothetical protein